MIDVNTSEKMVEIFLLKCIILQMIGIVILKLKPGERGTKKFLAEYGDRLVCIRYRYDEERGRRYKTVATIIEDIPWKASPGKNEMVFVKAKWNEKDLHSLLRNAGGDGTRKRNSGKYLTEMLLQSA
jgi:hypothetical protein